MVTIGLSGRQAGIDPAVVFVPEFCSTAASFTDMMRHLPDRRFGVGLATVSFDENGVLGVAGQDDAVTFAVDYRAPGGPATASRIGIRDKASELKRAIDFAKTRTGSSRVILVGHGMGGLVARAYIQGLGINPDGDVLGYDADVAGLITLDTPHRGVTADAMPADWDTACASPDSTNWREMHTAGEGSLLDALNRTPWPAGVGLEAIASYYSERGAHDTDGVVLRESQDARAISDYWAAHPDVRAWPQPLAARRLDGFSQMAAHSAVLRTGATAALVASLVQDIDERGRSMREARLAATTGLPESSHPYDDHTDDSYSYTLAGNPPSIDVAFDPRTNVEEDFDYIYVMDGSGADVAGSPFTGDQLAGRTLRIPGATVRIRLTTDGSVTRFGFKLTSVEIASAGVASSPLPESSHPYEDDYHGGWFYTHPGDPAAINVTFDARTSVESDYDYIHVTDADGREMGDSPYTGSTLAGKTIRVQGSSVRVILDSDGSVTDYGYKVTSVTPVSGVTGSVATQGASASIERTSTGVTYRTTFTLCETGGRSALAIASIRVNLRSSTRSGGGTFTAGTNLTTTSIAAGACNTYRLNVSSTNSTDFYTSVSFVITYSDATGTQTSYTTPTSASISPPSTTTPTPPSSSGSKYDGTYNFFFRYPNGASSSATRNLPGWLIIRNGRVTSSDNSITNGTVDLTFGTIRFTTDCPVQRSTFGADWEGIMNQSALAGANFGQGTYQCRVPFPGSVSLRSWQATQAR